MDSSNENNHTYDQNLSEELIDDPDDNIKNTSSSHQEIAAGSTLNYDVPVVTEVIPETNDSQNNGSEEISENKASSENVESPSTKNTSKQSDVRDVAHPSEVPIADGQTPNDTKSLANQSEATHTKADITPVSEPPSSQNQSEMQGFVQQLHATAPTDVMAFLQSKGNMMHQMPMPMILPPNHQGHVMQGLMQQLQASAAILQSQGNIMQGLMQQLQTSATGAASNTVSLQSKPKTPSDNIDVAAVQTNEEHATESSVSNQNNNVIITGVRDRDVKCGRRFGLNSRPANTAFMLVARLHQNTYLSLSCRGMKGTMSEIIRSAWYNAGGRFLKCLNEEEIKLDPTLPEIWAELTDKEANDRISMSLRQKVKKSKKWDRIIAVDDVIIKLIHDVIAEINNLWNHHTIRPIDTSQIDLLIHNLPRVRRLKNDALVEEIPTNQKRKRQHKTNLSNHDETTSGGQKKSQVKGKNKQNVDSEDDISKKAKSSPPKSSPKRKRFRTNGSESSPNPEDGGTPEEQSCQGSAMESEEENNDDAPRVPYQRRKRRTPANGHTFSTLKGKDKQKFIDESANFLKSLPGPTVAVDGQLDPKYVKNEESEGEAEGEDGDNVKFIGEHESV